MEEALSTKKEARETKKMLEEFKTKHEETRTELLELIENMQEQFEKYVKDILKVRQKLASPMYIYNSDKTVKEVVKEYVSEEEEKIKTALKKHH